MQAEFERELSKKIRTRRLTQCIICLLCLTLFIACWIMLEATKETITHGSPAPIPSWTSERYTNTGYIFPLVIGLVGCILCASMLLTDFMMCGFQTIRKDMQLITIYRSMLHNVVYVDGKEMGRIGPFMHTNVVEVWLQNRVKVTVCFSRSISYMAHVSFSDDTASREV